MLLLTLKHVSQYKKLLTPAKVNCDMHVYSEKQDQIGEPCFMRKLKRRKEGQREGERESERVSKREILFL